MRLAIGGGPHREKIDAVVHIAGVRERILDDHWLLVVLVGAPVDLAQDGRESIHAAEDVSQRLAFEDVVDLAVRGGRTTRGALNGRSTPPNWSGRNAAEGSPAAARSESRPEAAASRRPRRAACERAHQRDRRPSRG
eukprot:3228606-Prymnesium_polylepis.2